MRVVRTWHELPREVVDVPSMIMNLDGTLRNLIQGKVNVNLPTELNCLLIPFPHKLLYDFMILQLVTLLWEGEEQNTRTQKLNGWNHNKNLVSPVLPKDVFVSILYLYNKLCILISSTATKDREAAQMKCKSGK